MPQHSEIKQLPYSAEQLYNLVMDIERYPEFLPWCKSINITKRGNSYLEADLEVVYKIFHETFSSRVLFDQNKSIEIEYLNGPMKNLQNKWQFRDIRKGKSEIFFYIDFALRSRLMQMIANQFFEHALKRMIYAFEDRATEIYAKKNN